MDTVTNGDHNSRKDKEHTPLGLNWAQVHTNDLGPWILTREEVGCISYLNKTYFGHIYSLILRVYRHTNSATSIAQIPVPVPTSKMRWGFSLKLIRWSRPSSSMQYMWCTRSSLGRSFVQKVSILNMSLL